MNEKIGGYAGSGNRADVGPPPSTGSATAPKEPTNYLQFTDAEIRSVMAAMNTLDDESLTDCRGSTDEAFATAYEKIEKHIRDFALDQ